MCNTSNNNKTLSCLAAAVLIGAGFAMTSNAATVKNFAELSNAIVAKDANIVIAAPIAISGALPAIDFATTISGNYDGTSVIDGGGQYAGFTIVGNETEVTIKGITIRNTKSGVTNDNKEVRHGAAINNSGILKIDSCHFENNVVDIADARLNRVARAGAIYSVSELDVKNSSFFGNSVKGANGYELGDGQTVVNTVGEGGAIYIAGTAKIWNCTFSGNVATGGNGLSNIETGGVAGADGRGGALAITLKAEADIEFCTFVGNIAQGGDGQNSTGGGSVEAGVGRGGAIYINDTHSPDSWMDSNTKLHSCILANSQTREGKVIIAAIEAGEAEHIVHIWGNVDGKSNSDNVYQNGESEGWLADKAIKNGNWNGTWVYPITPKHPAYNVGAGNADIIRDQRGVKRPRTIVNGGTGYDSGAYQIEEYTIKADDQEFVYLEWTNIDPTKYVVLDADGTPVLLPGTVELSCTQPNTAPVGVYPDAIVPVLNADPNFTYVIIPGTLTITKAKLVVQAKDQTFVYGTPIVLSQGTAWYTITPNVEISGVADLSSDFEGTIQNVGEYADKIMPSEGTMDVSNYDVIYLPGKIIITKAKLTVQAEDQTFVYGTPITLAQGIDWYTLTPDVEITGVAKLTSEFEGTIQNVGEYPGKIVPTQGTMDVSNYDVTYLPGKITITKAPLVVQAKDQTFVYGETITLSQGVEWYTLTPNVEITGVAKLTSDFEGTIQDVGEYPGKIVPTQGTMDVSNYDVTYLPGKITVTKAALVVQAKDQTFVYGTPITLAQGVEWYTVTPNVTLSGVAKLVSDFEGTIQNVGTYADKIMPTQGSLDTKNYDVTYLPGNIIIIKAKLTVQAKDQTFVYGTPITLAQGIEWYTLTPNVDITGVANLTSDFEGTIQNVGEYPGKIVPTQGTMDVSNYDVTYLPGKITIIKAKLTVKAKDQTFVYGTPIVLNQGVEWYTLTPEVAITGVAGLTSDLEGKTPDVGVYENRIMPNQGTMDVSNYDVTYLPGNITVTKLALVIKAKDQEFVYGTPITLAQGVEWYTVTPNVTLSGVAKLVSDFEGTIQNVGTYADKIMPTQGSLDTKNYDVTYLPGNIIIKKAKLVVQAKDQTFVYGETIVLNQGTAWYTLTPNVEITGVAKLSSDFEGTIQNVGVYADKIMPSEGTMDVSNYDVTYLPGKITITKAKLTVKAKDQTFVYGTAIVLSQGTEWYTLTPNVEITGVAKLVSGMEGTKPNVGTYENKIMPEQGTMDVSNYDVTYLPGNIIVTKAALVVKAKDQEFTYGDAIKLNQGKDWYTLTPDVEISGVAKLVSDMEGTKPNVGTYENKIMPEKGSMDVSNYDVTYLPGNIIIKKAKLTVKAKDQEFTYGEAIVLNQGTAWYTLTPNVTITGVANLSSDMEGTKPNVGTYENKIMPSEGTMDVSNYDVTYLPGNIIVKKAKLTVTAKDQVFEYGEAIVLSQGTEWYTLSPDVEITGIAKLISDMEGTTPDAGVYPNKIMPTQGTMDVSNYDVTYVPGKITVLKTTYLAALPGMTRRYGQENTESTVDYLTPTNTVKCKWSKEDLVFVKAKINAENKVVSFDNKIVTFAEIKDAFTGDPIFVTEANRLSNVGKYLVQIKWGSFNGKNAQLVDIDGNVIDSYKTVYFSDNVAYADKVNELIKSTSTYAFGISHYLKVVAADLDIHAVVDFGGLKNFSPYTFNPYTDKPMRKVLRSELVKNFLNYKQDILDANMLYYYGTVQEDGTRLNYFVNGEDENDLLSRPRTRKLNRFEDFTEPGVHQVVPFGAQSENYNIHRFSDAFNNDICVVFNDLVSCLEEGPVPVNFTYEENGETKGTGLFEQIVLVRNSDELPWIGIDLYVLNVDVRGAEIVNAVDYNGKYYTLRHNYTVQPGEVVAFVVEYAMKDKKAFYSNYPKFQFTPLYAEAGDTVAQYDLATGNVLEGTNVEYYYAPENYGANNTGFYQEDWTFSLEPMLPYGLTSLERYGWAAWVNVGIVLRNTNAVAGKEYQVQYRNELTGEWIVVAPTVKADKNGMVVWADKGAPKTATHPILNEVYRGRFYQIVEK